MCAQPLIHLDLREVFSGLKRVWIQQLSFEWRRIFGKAHLLLMELRQITRLAIRQLVQTVHKLVRVLRLDVGVSDMLLKLKTGPKMPILSNFEILVTLLLS